MLSPGVNVVMLSLLGSVAAVTSNDVVHEPSRPGLGAPATDELANFISGVDSTYKTVFPMPAV
jgi:hypothetical protein